MKCNYLIILFFLSVACSKPSSDKKDSVISDAPSTEIPATATREKFADNPDMEKITISDAQGNLASEGILINAKKEGAWTEYNGDVVKSVTSFVHGKKEGIYIEMTTTGQFAKRISYHNDVRHGTYLEYLYPNKKEQRTYQNGKLEGTVKLFYPDGKIMEESSYKNDTRDGVSKWYDNAGNVTINYEYKNGELVKK